MKKIELLIEKIKNIRKKIKRKVDKRILELKQNFLSEERIFSELCFCILTANERAKKGLEIQNSIGDGFQTFSENELRDFLKNKGYRFYNIRAKYIVEARKFFGKIKDIIRNLNREEKRMWLVKNIKGLGMKEASHFLRNIGFLDYAIIDRHIIKILEEYKILNLKNKKINLKLYLKLERALIRILKLLKKENINMKLGELDFYLWYLKTKRVIK